MAHSGKGWVSCWMRSGRYTYRKGRRAHDQSGSPDSFRRYTLGHAAPSASSPIPGREAQVANGVPRADMLSWGHYSEIGEDGE